MQPPTSVTDGHLTTIGADIRAARTKQELTQQQLGALAGIDQRTVHSIETGHTDPTISVLIRVAEALNVHVTHLVVNT